MRIVSLLPSATEIVCALGLADHLVGISHDCDHPPEIRSRPVLSQAVVTTDLPSGLIDARIRGQVHRGLSVYHLDADQLARLRPDLILTQELCQVCAPSYTLVTQAAKVLEADTRIVSLEPAGLDGILDTIRLVGEMTGTAARARALVGELRARIERVRAAVAGRPRPRVAAIEWLDPIYVGGHWVPEMVEIAGGRDLFGRSGEPSFVVEWTRIREAAPDVIVVMPCGFDVARARREIGLLTSRPGWPDLPAVRGGRVYLTDASAYFNRPGPRIVTGLEILAAILHPGAPVPAPPPDAVERLRPPSA
ncbi:MAG TPA: cobalamin-binding protein [candidate division Zixibacteria bacterium]|nr:cobalamin-binding protein [candidate division Zixibacteria bacterium]